MCRLSIKAENFLFTTASRLILCAQKSPIIQWLNGEMFIRGEAWTSLFFSTEWDEQECVQLRNSLRIRNKNTYSENADVFRCGRGIAKRDYLIPHICPSVRMEQLRSHWTDFHDIWYLIFFWGGRGGNLSREITFQSNLTRIAGTLYKDLCTCMKTPRRMLLKMFHTKVEEKIKTYFTFNNSFPKIVPFMR
jgi:hypothetical protein